MNLSELMSEYVKSEELGRTCKSSSASESTLAVTASTSLSTEMTKPPRSPRYRYGQSSESARPGCDTNSRDCNEAENDMATIISTPSQPLHDRLRDLEERWSVSSSRKAKRAQVHSRESITSNAAVSRRSPPVQVPVPIVETPDRKLRRRQSLREPSVGSIFDRLYRDAKSKVRQEASRKTPSRSVDESTISTLSSSESVFDRLYRNEKRTRTPLPKSGRRNVASNESHRKRAMHRTLSASASLERRLAYTPPAARQKNRVVGRPSISAAQGVEPLSPIKPKSLHTGQSRNLSTDSIFERLHRGEKRSASSLMAKSNAQRRRPTRRDTMKSTVPRSKPVEKKGGEDILFRADSRGEASASSRARSAKEVIADFLIPDDGRKFTPDSALFLDSDHILQTRLEHIRKDFFVTRIQRAVRKWLLTEALVESEDSFLYNPHSARGEEEDELLQHLAALRRECEAVITIQNAWRVHLAQLAVALALVESWSLQSVFVEEGVCHQRTLDARLKVCAISKAVGRVDSWSLTEGAPLVDKGLRIFWEKEIGVHFFVRGVPKLESCYVYFQCKTRRSPLVSSWRRRQHVLLTVKAQLGHALRLEQQALDTLAATTIQAWGRMISDRLCFMETVRSAQSVQRLFRKRNYKGDVAQVSREPYRSSVGLASQSSSENQQEYATEIQAGWRAFRERERFLIMRCASIAIQSRQRARAHMMRLTVLRSGFIRFQGLYRGVRGRKTHGQSVLSATKVQSAWRCAVVRRPYVTCRICSIMIQSVCRRHLARDTIMRRLVESRKEIATRIILRYCEHFVRRSRYTKLLAERSRRNHAISARLERREGAALVIQSIWRGASARHAFVSLRVACVMIQSVSRGLHSAIAFKLLRLGVLSLQSRYRERRELAAMQARHRPITAMEMQTRKDCAVDRSYTATLQTMDRQLIEMERAALLRQYAWRDTYSVRRIDSIVCIQALFRGTNWRRRLKWSHASAQRIQIAWATYCSRRQKKRLRYAATVIQSTTRRFLCQERLRGKLSAAKKIQSAFRFHWQRANWYGPVYVDMGRADDAARLIQVVYASWKMDFVLLSLESSVVLLQRSSKRQLSRSAARFALTHINECLGSRALYTFHRVGETLKQEASPVALSVMSLSFSWIQAVETARHAAAVVIQCATRRMIAQNRTKPFCAAILLHSLPPSDPAKPLEDTGPSLTIDFPGHIRPIPGRHTTQQVGEHFSRVLAATLIQTILRTRFYQRRYKMIRSQTIILQAVARGRFIRAWFFKLRCTAIKVQLAWRRALFGRRFFDAYPRHGASVLLQCHVRRYQCVRLYRLKKESATRLQGQARQWLSRRQRRLSAQVEDQIISTCEKQAQQAVVRLLRENRRLDADSGICVARLINRVAGFAEHREQLGDSGRRAARSSDTHVKASIVSVMSPPANDPFATRDAPVFTADFLSPIAKSWL